MNKTWTGDALHLKEELIQLEHESKNQMKLMINLVRWETDKIWTISQRAW